MKFSKPVGYYVGNLFMVLSIIGLMYIYFPIIQLYFFPPPPPHVSYTTDFVITIPKINAVAKIIPNVDPWNENEYGSKLDQGVAHARGSSLPGESGTMYLFAHSSQPPWKITRENVSFLRLGELNNSDEIDIFKEGKKYTYHVVDKKEVWPSDTQYLRNLQKDQLILQTCTPIGTALKRLLIFAVIQNS